MFDRSWTLPGWKSSMKELGKSGYLQKLMWLSGVSDSHRIPMLPWPSMLDEQKRQLDWRCFNCWNFKVRTVYDQARVLELAASHHYKGRDGKGWIPLVWLLGYNESLSDSIGSWILDWYVWTMTKQSLSSTIEVLILSWRVFMHFVIVWGHTLGEYSRVNKFVCMANRLPHF
jgi:hypothetical protein